MKRRRGLKLAATGLVGLLLLVIFFIAGASPAAPRMINYQGRLTDSGGNPLNGTYSITFKLYNVASGGTAIWTETHSNATVTNGLFSVLLGSTNPLSASLFTGTTYLGVKVGGDPEMTPRQQIVSVPYALVAATTEIPLTLSGSVAYPSAIIKGTNTGTGHGVWGFSDTGYGVYGYSRSNYGVWGFSDSGGGVFGKNSSSGNFGYLGGYSTGVYGYSYSGTGVYGESIYGPAVHGYSHTDTGVYGYSSSSPGVHGYSYSNYGVFGESISGYAGYFNGNVRITGNLSKGSGGFKIDHPLDPESKYLSHSFVESPDMMNIYNGNVVLDENGEAWVELPNYFEALNKDFRYQLTPIGAPAPNLYIAEEISNNRFKIAGSKPGMKVSWQVTGIRQDPYANVHRIKVEEEKPAAEQGYYLHPLEWGQPEEKGIDWAREHGGGE